MSHSAVCWHCGASLAELTLPLSRFDVCKQCRVELHVCRLCRFHDATVAKQCREPVAEEVRDKQRANICDYFSVRADAYRPIDTAAIDQSRAQLEALFGKPAAQADTQDNAAKALQDLFGSKKI
jgi:ribosomal protein L40E